MNVRVCLPAPLQPYAEGRAEVPLAAGTVGEAISALAARYPGMAPHLLAGGGRVRSFLAVFLNDQDVRHLGGLSAPLGDGDVLTLVPSVAGGSGRGARPTGRPAVPSAFPARGQTSNRG
jgi:molybdopterin converting factor small subunit